MLKKILNKLVIKRKPVRIPTNYSPNILLTSYCNQNCSFCFASHLMGKRNKTNHISFEKYAKLLDYLEKNGINEVFLMGGEPTMHPDFIKIIRETVDRGFAIELFTNGVFSDEIRDFLISLGNQIKMYHLNLAAPIYGKSNVAKKKLAEFVRVVKNFSDISLTLTIDSFEQNYLKQVLSIGLNNLKNCSVRIGVAGLFTWKDGFSLKKNKEIGKMIVSMSCELLSKRHVKSVYLTEITRCMFEDDEWKNIEKMKKLNFVN